MVVGIEIGLPSESQSEVAPSLGLGLGSLVSPSPFWNCVRIGPKQGHHIHQSPMELTRYSQAILWLRSPPWLLQVTLNPLLGTSRRRFLHPFFLLLVQAHLPCTTLNFWLDHLLPQTSSFVVLCGGTSTLVSCLILSISSPHSKASWCPSISTILPCTTTTWFNPPLSRS